MDTFRKYMIGFVFGLIIGGLIVGAASIYDNYLSAKSRIPDVTEADLQSLPPNYKNVKSMGNHWISFDIESEDKKVRQFWIRRGQSDIIIQVQ